VLLCQQQKPLLGNPSGWVPEGDAIVPAAVGKHHPSRAGPFCRNGLDDQNPRFSGALRLDDLDDMEPLAVAIDDRPDRPVRASQPHTSERIAVAGHKLETFDVRVGSRGTVTFLFSTDDVKVRHRQLRDRLIRQVWKPLNGDAGATRAIFLPAENEPNTNT
jgi:hypothetical protein